MTIYKIFLEGFSMKKIKSFFSFVLLSIMLCCCVLFAGCSDAGTYKLSSVRYTYYNNSITAQVGDTYQGTVLTEDMFCLVLNSDNSCALRTTVTFNGDDLYNSGIQVQTGTWTSGYESEIYLQFDNSSNLIICTKNNDTITLALSSDIVITLKK